MKTMPFVSSTETEVIFHILLRKVFRRSFMGQWTVIQDERGGELNICVLDSESHAVCLWIFSMQHKKRIVNIGKGICWASVESVSASGTGFSSSSCTLDRRKPSDCWKSKLICSNSSAGLRTRQQHGKNPFTEFYQPHCFSPLLCAVYSNTNRERGALLEMYRSSL